MKSVAAAVQFAYLRLHGAWESAHMARALSGALVAVFGSTVALALVNASGWFALPGWWGRVHVLHAVEITFTLLLFFEMISLVFVIPASIANSLGKQIGILSLVLVRSSFKEFAHYHFAWPVYRQLGSVYKMMADGVGALLVFLLLGVYYAQQRHRPVAPEAHRHAFVRLKQGIALLVLGALLALAAHDGAQAWRTGHLVPSVGRFYLVLIFADLLLLLVAFRYTRAYAELFRYSAFVLVTVFLRFSLVAPPYYNAGLGVFSALFAIAVAYCHRRFTASPRPWAASNSPLPRPAVPGSDRPQSGASP
ncbi:hypothetical protein Q3A66_09595 [Hymenobacter sp. BT770]|uniref:hypothetical protein n=1 Tax=Hymenobacter sp. BT770 TaxID=2886942 RepID=UPI001D11A206|nr:hypothetical protein [Hymenobacter sp. BT770]MCC3153205.1 hypothetical protein [Hymenobacter sp. BT770]MDO3415321.1 hypothetical protein [Hymenobacter sp. BT770]